MKTRVSKSLVIWPILIALFLALTGFAIAGCDSSTADAAGDTTDNTAVIGSALTLTADDNGKSYTVSVGDTITVVLEGNPTTGYTWESDLLATGFATLILLDDEPLYTPAETDSQIVGGGGTFTFDFQAITAGPAEIKLKYWRPFEPETEPLETFSVDLTIE